MTESRLLLDEVGSGRSTGAGSDGLGSSAVPSIV
jgi:hypothetical protein